MDQIRKLIVQGRLDAAFEDLLKQLTGSQRVDAEILHNRWNYLNRDNRSGILSYGEYSREKNKIVKAALELCHVIQNNNDETLADGKTDLKDKEPHSSPTEKKSINMATPKKIFFSYSKHDRQFLEELQVHMSLLRRNGKIQPWNDHDILPGEEWDEKIRQELGSADVILLLISANFLATDYIWEVELEKAMARHEKGEARVIPVVIRPCSWEAAPFGKLNGLPSKAKPVSKFDDRDEAWLQVVKGIERIL